MPIYTTYDMIRDCRQGRPEGREHFVVYFVPATSFFIGHYRPELAGDAELLQVVVRRVLEDGGDLFSWEEVPERWFLVELRSAVLRIIEQERPAQAPAIRLDLATLATALEGFTVVDRQAVWLEAMRHAPEQASTLLNIEPATARRARERAAELLRQAMDGWSGRLIWDNGPSLQQEAAAQQPAQALPVKHVLDMIDGRSTWNQRQEIELAMKASWGAVDLVCRLREAAELTRESKMLSEEEAEPFRKLLGIEKRKRSGWRSLFAGA